MAAKLSETEKITINLGFVDLGQIDLLVQEGFYSNRTDMIRTAIRNQLSTHAEVVRRAVVRKTLVLGLQDFARADLETLRASGTRLHIRVVGLVRIADDVTPALARADHRIHSRARRAAGECRREGSARRPHPITTPGPDPMNLQNPLLADMADATRLLRQGDLRAATAAIQEHLRRGAPRDESQTVRDAIDGEFVVEAADPASVVTEVGDECEAGQAPSPRPHDPAPEPTGLDRFSSHAFHGRPGARDYKLYVPARYRGQAMPLIVMLHGCTQSPDDFSAGTQVNALAEEQGFLVAYPAQSRSANASLCWNWFNASEQRRDGSEASIIRGIVAEIQGAYAIDPCRIFVAGLSAGGAMAAIMAAAHSDLFAAACVHSGLPVGAAHDMPSALAAMRGGSGNTALPFIAGAAASRGRTENHAADRVSRRPRCHCKPAQRRSTGGAMARDGCRT